ncbi:MAG: NADPH-dependent F420 reductase [Owenweeksia sp.]
MGYKIGILGSGMVGQALAEGFLGRGDSVMIGSRIPEKLSDWKKEAGENALTGNFSETAAYGKILVLAVQGQAALNALELAGHENLKSKVIIDTTNPIGNEPPVNGVLNFFTSLDHSLMEQLQTAVPGAHFVKAFNSVGSRLMVNPDFEGDRPSMFICGNDEEAKSEVSAILNDFGWDAEDMGSVEAARAIEPLCILWCIPGFKDNDWNHAFKLLRA